MKDIIIQIKLMAFKYFVLPNYMKKIIAPIVYLLFGLLSLILTFIISVAVSFPRGWYTSIFVAVLISLGTYILHLGNRSIRKIDILKNPTIIDHFRQSCLYYAVLILEIIFSLTWNDYYYFVFKCKIHCGLYEERFLLFILTPLLAIIINGFYLYQRRKANVI